MTSTAAMPAPAAPTNTNGALPPSLPAGSTTGAGTTAAASTPPATAGTSTSFVATTNSVGGGYQAIPAPPGSCTMPPPVMQEPAKGIPTQTSGGGAVAGVNGAALAPVLQQLTAVIGQLGTAVGGVRAGGPGATPEQMKAPGKEAMGGGAAPAAPAPSTVAGANGAPAANATQGAQVVQGGGHADSNMEALVKALQGVIESLTSLIASLGGRIEGGGPGKPPVPTQLPPSDVKGDHGPGKDPAQKPLPPSDVKGDHGPGKDPAQKPLPPSEVKGDSGPGQQPAQKPLPPSEVKGDSGPGQQPAQKPLPPVEQAPAVAGANGGTTQQAPVQQSPVAPPAVAGSNGGGTQQSPPPAKAPEKPAVAGSNGGVVQQAPAPSKPAPPAVGGSNGGGAPAPAKPVVTKGNVVLDNDDNRWSAKLVAKGGKAEHSVELWGDPHVVITVDGKAERFDVGYGAGKVTLFDGTKITWDTYAKGDKHQFILRDFKVDSAGTELDRAVTTRDRNGDKGDQMGLTTALTDAHLREFATALRTMKGPMSDPLRNGTWVSTQFGVPKPTQKPAA